MNYGTVTDCVALNPQIICDAYYMNGDTYLRSSWYNPVGRISSPDSDTVSGFVYNNALSDMDLINVKPDPDLTINDVIDLSIGPDTMDGADLQLDDAKTAAAYDWDFEIIWKIDEGISYPTLQPVVIPE